MTMRMNRMDTLGKARQVDSHILNELQPFLGTQAIGKGDQPSDKPQVDSDTSPLCPVRRKCSRSFGEVIDPAVEDKWLSEFYQAMPSKPRKRPIDDYRDAYHYGLLEKSTRRKFPFEKVEEALEDQWELLDGSHHLVWSEARGVVRHAYNRPLPFPHSKLRLGK